MKHNLKNRPVCSWQVCPDGTMDLSPIEKWFGAFEAELREYINFIDNARSHAPSTEMKTKYKVYKEILGE